MRLALDTKLDSGWVKQAEIWERNRSRLPAFSLKIL